MSDEKSGEPAQQIRPQFYASGAKDAPVIFFDAAPVFGAFDGTIRITLSMSCPVPEGDRIKDEFVVTAFLRCGIEAAKNLREHLDKAILLASPTDGKTQ